MKLLMIVAVFGWHESIFAFEATDVIERARLSSFLPNLNFRYAKHESNQIFWVGLTWDFDESLFGAKSLAAIEIQRLQRESDLLKSEFSNLDIESLPSFD